MDTRAGSKIKMDIKPLDVPGSDQEAVMPQGVGTHHPEPLPVVQLMPQGGGALTGGMTGMAVPDPKHAFWRLCTAPRLA